MIIKGYLQTSVIEWPGKISSIVFTAGCNFRCSFCYNKDLVDQKSAGLPQIPEERILTDLVKRKKWVDAVVVTGGEPTMQPDLEEFLKKVKKMGFLTMIETNGSNPETIARLLDCYIVDRVAMDIKGPFEKYTEITKMDNGEWTIDKIKGSIELILKSGVEYEFRTTVVPGIHNKQVILKMANDLQQFKNLAKGKDLVFRFAQNNNRNNITIEQSHWKLQNFQPKNCLDPEYNKLKPFSEEEFEELQKIII